jgi:phosphatidylserine/phosphatidylglycerophosphate/cardiolipin synthase-like enzyme
MLPENLDQGEEWETYRDGTLINGDPPDLFPHRRCTAVDYVRNLVDGSEVLPVLLQDLRAATSTIHVSMFLFFNDPIGREVARVLEAKASDTAHPVKVRVLLDEDSSHRSDPFSVGDVKRLVRQRPSLFAQMLDIQALVAELRAAGVEVHNTKVDLARPPETGTPVFDADAEAIRHTVGLFGPIPAGIPGPFTVWNVDHRKIITIDGRVGYCGSANIGAQYLYHQPFNPAREAWAEAGEGPEPWAKLHDGLVRFEGPVVAEFDQLFRERWVLDGGPDFAPALPAAARPGATGQPVQRLRVVPGQPMGAVNPIRTLFLEMIGGAHSSIFIENPYLLHPQIKAALVTAKQRRPHLRIDLVLPAEKWNDSALDQDAQRYGYQEYLPVGINIFEYQSHFNHLKVATFDERFAIVGSANLNFRSLEDDRDFELVVLVEDPAFTFDINQRVRDRDMTYSRRFKLRDVQGLGSKFWPINTRGPLTLLGMGARLI